ncbi:MAG: type II secretion system F family protein [Clostridia bacterium]|nr:type II secretion system F family protein [Clostridia bacterium]MDD4049106.1 type II secretion system F family protein [Clostridia bacterium]
MASFTCEAVSGKGKRIKKVCEARNSGEVIKSLKDEGLYPVKVEEIVVGKEIRSPISFDKVKRKDIVFFCRQIATLLNAGIPLADALQIISDQILNKNLRIAVSEVSEDVQKGLPFSDAMKKQNVFPALLVHMVAASELSGTINKTMNRMADNYEKDLSISRKIKGAMVYPILLGFVAIGAVVFIITTILPRFADMFESANLELPALTKFLIKMSEVLRNDWLVIVGAIVAIVVGFLYVARTQVGRRTLDILKLEIPIVKSTNIKIITARFARTMSGLLSSGIPLVQSMEYVANVLENVIVKEKIMRAKEDISKGAELTDSLRKMGIFEKTVIHMMKIGEESGKMDEILENTANLYDGEVETSIQSMASLVEPIMIIIMAGAVGFVVLSVIMPMFEMAGGIG